MDTGILYGIQDVFANPALDAFFPAFTQIGEFGLVWLVLGICMLFSRKWRFWGICIIASVACVGLFNELGLKHFVGRTRPYIAEGYASILADPPTSPSFPSGHAGCAFAACVVLTLSPAKARWKVLAWLLALALCFSRLYLFVHYPTDVLAGAVLGTLYAFVVVKIATYIRDKRNTAARGKHATL